MAGNKNYQAYREEIGKLSLFFAFENNDNDASIELGK